jgi:hypothetical protein
VHSLDNDEATAVCYGAEHSCTLINLKPTISKWDEVFYLNYGRHGATANNKVSAQRSYATEDYSEVYSSDYDSLDASFTLEGIEFDNFCLDTCSVSKFKSKSYKLVFELDGGSKLYLDEISYSTTTKNEAPIFSHIPNYRLLPTVNLTINLSEYVYDPDGDELRFTYYEPKDLDISIAGDIVTIAPEDNFTNIRFTFFVANDSRKRAISNVFKIEPIKETY